MADLERQLIDQAHQLGFELCGIAPAAPADGFDRLLAWLDAGHAGEMNYMHVHREARRHPRAVFSAVRSVVMVGMNYAPRQSSTANRTSGPFRGRVARYARGADYHRVLRERLKQLGAWLRRQRPEAWGRVVVDTAPLLERDFARRAGLGWFGKNTMLLNKRLGSWFVLGALLVDIDLEASPPHEASHCGTCTACLDACPTNAFVEPGLLDSRRCISYLTIELKTPVPAEQRTWLGDWLFGCDVCQEVCPWNRKAPTGGPALAARADLEEVDLVELLGLSEVDFRARFEGTALFPRPGRPVILRNAALVLGNTADERALPALERALNDPEAMVRAAARWAIGRIRSRRTGVPACPAAPQTAPSATDASDKDRRGRLFRD
jgi:epoxyqueuosine reductase